MKRLIEYSLEGGGLILVEVDGCNQPAAEYGAPVQPRWPKGPGRLFETSLERIKPAAAAIVARIRELSDKPEQIGVEFGIKLSAEAGVVIASTGVEANFKVTLLWKRA